MHMSTSKKIRAATDMALEMLSPVNLVDRNTTPKEIWRHPYVVGFVAAFCTAAASVVFKNRHSQDQTSRVIEGVYERLFQIAGRELTESDQEDKSSASEGWDNAFLILRVIRGDASAADDPRAQAARQALPKDIIAKQGEGPATVGVLWNELFVRRVGALREARARR